MKLKRINYIKNIGSFNNFKWDEYNIKDFHDKWNIFYGINGTGKTTLSEIIRSISLGEYTNDIKSKNEKYLGKFKIIHDGGEFEEYKFGKNENIKVFDKRFVEENVFSLGGAKPIILIAEKSEEISLKIEKIDESIKMFTNKIDKFKDKILKKEKNLNSDKSNIGRIISEKINDKTFNKLKVDQYLNNNFEKKKYTDEEIESFKNSLFEERKGAIPQIHVFNEDFYKKLYEDFAIIMKKTIEPDNISFNSDTELWIHKGLSIHKNKEICEFCGNIIDKNRYDLLLKHFNNEYQQVLTQIEEQIDLIDKNKLDENLFDSGNLYKEFYAKYVKLKEAYKKEAKNINSRLLFMIELLQNKRKSIGESVNINIDNYNFNAIKMIIENINDLIQKHNDKSLSFQSAQNEAKNKIIVHFCSELYDNHLFLDQKKKIYNLNIKRFNRKIKKLEELKNNLFSQIKPEKKAEIKINEKIHAIMGNNEISLLYTENGYQILRTSTGKVFKPSEGECMIIGFAYFLVKLQESNTDIVVFDDPMSSLDEDNLYRIFSIISLMKNEGKQIFIFTHHYQFLRLFIDDSLIQENANYYRINKCSGYSDIFNMEESLKKYKSEYHFIFRTLYEFWQESNKGEIDIEICYNYANMARKLLEIFTSIYSRDSNLKQKFLLTFSGKNFDKFDKELIYKFINNFSHNNSIDSIKPQDMTIYKSNLPNIIEQIMTMIQIKNPDHFKEMIQN